MSDLVLALTGPTTHVLGRCGPQGELRLTAAEAERMARLRRSSDRDDFLAAHVLVRVCAARLLGVAASEVSLAQRCATCGGPHGRPEVPGHPELGVSLAHSRGVVAAAAGTVPVGIDVEAFPPAGELAAGDLSAALTAAEMAAIESAADRQRAVVLAWVRKEACLKAGLVELDDLGGFDLSALPLDAPPGYPGVRGRPHAGWCLYDWWEERAGAIGAVAAPTGAEVTLAGP